MYNGVQKGDEMVLPILYGVSTLLGVYLAYLMVYNIEIFDRPVSAIYGVLLLSLIVGVVLSFIVGIGFVLASIVASLIIIILERYV